MRAQCQRLIRQRPVSQAPIVWETRWGNAGQKASLTTMLADNILIANTTDFCVADEFLILRSLMLRVCFLASSEFSWKTATKPSLKICLVSKPLATRGGAHQSNVDLAVGQQVQLFLRGVQMHIEPGRGILGAESAQCIGQDRMHGRAHRTDAQHPRPQTASHARFIDGIGQGADDSLSFVGKDLPCRGELDASGVAVKKTHTKALFQLADLLAQRGLADAENFRRAPKVEFIGHAQEISKMSDFNALHDYVAKQNNYAD